MQVNWQAKASRYRERAALPTKIWYFGLINPTGRCSLGKQICIGHILSSFHRHQSLATRRGRIHHEAHLNTVLALSKELCVSSNLLELHEDHFIPVISAF